LIPPRRATVALAAFTLAFIVFATLVFAALTVSSQALWAFPIVVSLWVAFLWTFTGKAIASWSTRPHQMGRVTAIIVACGVIAIVALAAAILAGLLIVGPRSAAL